MRYFPLLILALLLSASCVHAAPPKPNFADLPAYLKALNASTDSEARAIRQHIAAGPADLARERIAAEKEGIPTRPDELSQALPPADQNAAPLYVQLEALRKQKPLRFPMYAQPLNGRYAYTPEQTAVVQKEYDARQDIFTLLHQAADKPQCVFAHDYSKGFNGDSFQNYAGLRESAREINTESLLLAYKGGYSEAASNQERGFHIAAHAASEPLLINFLVGGALEAITVNGLQTILDKAGPSAYLDNHVVADLALLQSQPNDLSLRHNLSGEAAVADAEFSQFRRATPIELSRAVLGDSLPDAKPLVSPPARFTAEEQAQVANLVDASEADYIHQMRQLIGAADLPRPVRQAVFQKIDAATQQVDAATQAVANDPVQKVVAALIPGISRMGDAADRVQAERAVTTAGAAVLAVKAQTGVFPDTLPPRYTDPFTGKPLGYRREGTVGFVAYSAGPSGSFDGGKPGEKTPPRDSLFRYPAVPLALTPDMLK